MKSRGGGHPGALPSNSMPDAPTLAAFSVAAVALLVVPGPAVLYIVTRSVDQGRAAGLVSVAGIHVGTLVHVAAAAAGLSALLVSSAAAYTALRWAGAAYLIVLGARRLLARRPAPADALLPRRSLAATFRQGVVVNVRNPKTALFFLAFLPQFVDPAAGPVAPQALLLGGLFVVLGTVSDGAYALAAAALGDRLRRGGRARRLERASGAVYLGLGALALAGHRPAVAAP